MILNCITQRNSVRLRREIPIVIAYDSVNIVQCIENVITSSEKLEE